MSNKKTVHIFDLDLTIIDSSHRTGATVAEYRKNQTHQNIMKDSLLPLAFTMRLLMDKGETVAIVTSRHMIKSDYIFLRQNGLRPTIICSRDKAHKLGLDGAREMVALDCGEYKRRWFKALKARFDPTSYDFIMYDDHQGVLAVAQQEGFKAMDAIKLNELLAFAYAEGLEEGLAEGELYLSEFFID